MALPVDGTAQSTSHARAHSALVDVKAYFGAVGDDAVDDTTAIQNAYASGKRLFFPEGVYKHSGTLVVPDNAHWEGAAVREKDASSGGVKLHYTGTGTALSLAGVNSCRLENFQVACTGSGATGLHLADPVHHCQFQNMVFIGPSSGSGKGLLMDGQSSCVCSNTFVNCYWKQWDDCLRLSGFANANHFLNCEVGVCATGINLSKFGSDTVGGTDNIFERFELDGGTTKGVTLADSAARNLFLKVQCDGVTNGYSITANCSENMFILSAVAVGTYSDLSPTTLYLGCSGVLEGLIRGGPAGSYLPVNGLKVGAYAYTPITGISLHDAMRAEGTIQAGYGGSEGTRIGLVGPSSKEGVDFALDTNLYRDAANLLKTDDLFVAGAGIGVGNSAAATTPGSVVKKIQVFDASGSSLGYIAVYSTIT